MKFIEYSEKLETIKYLCEHKRAGTPQQLGKKLDVSGRTVKRMIQQLKYLGFSITYNRNRNSYELEKILRDEKLP